MDIESAIKLSKILKNEGQIILKDKGILSILNSYGKTTIVGSFDLELLIKPDIDLYVEIEDYDIKKHFEVLGSIANNLRPIRVKYLDLRQANWKDFPMKEGLFIGINLEHNGKEWSIDGWALRPEVYTERVNYHNNIKDKIFGNKFDILFQIKYDIYKCKDYKSVDLYDAVLSHNVTSTEDYYKWFELKYSRIFQQ